MIGGDGEIGPWRRLYKFLAQNKIRMDNSRNQSEICKIQFWLGALGHTANKFVRMLGQKLNIHIPWQGPHTEKTPRLGVWWYITHTWLRLAATVHNSWPIFISFPVSATGVLGRGHCYSRLPLTTLTDNSPLDTSFCLIKKKYTATPIHLSKHLWWNTMHFSSTREALSC